MDAATHDRIFGAISHLPHVVAFAVVNAVASAYPDSLVHAGSGFRDFTRIAASHPETWRDIVLSNREQILASMASVQKEFAAIRDLIERQDAERLLDTFRRAGESRRSLQAPGSGARKRGRKRKT
jgi:prephenate dehydrogenase